MMTIHTDDMRKFYAYSIANTPVGEHFKDALDEIDRLREGLREIADISRQAQQGVTDLAWLLQLALIEGTARELMGNPKLIPTEGEVSSE
jgi:hypothetical protein